MASILRYIFGVIIKMITILMDIIMSLVIFTKMYKSVCVVYCKTIQLVKFRICQLIDSLQVGWHISCVHTVDCTDNGHHKHVD